MSEADRKRHDHVVLPRRLAGLALLERRYASPADNLLDLELAALGRPGDTVLDPWAGTGWTARRGVAAGLRVVAAEPSPFGQLAAQALLFAPDARAIQAAFSQLSASRRVDVPLRQHIEELYLTRCATCRRPVVADQFIWPRDAPAPQRKIYRCANCDLAVGALPERVAPIDENDLTKLGLDELAKSLQQPTATPAAAGGLAAADPNAELPQPAASPPSLQPDSGPRWASTVNPQPVRVEPGDVRQGLQYQQLAQRFPVLDGRDEIVDELLALYTPRNLYALQTIANKIDAEFRDEPMAAVMRLALAACLLPASRLNGHPGRVASLRISHGHVRQPASRNQREVNVWHLFDAAIAEVAGAVAPLAAGRATVRFATDLADLGGMAGANVLWVRARPAVVGQYLPAESVDLVVGAPAAPPSIDELSFEYLATAWLMGREAAETLPLEALFGSPVDRDGAAEATALRHAIASAAGTLKPDGWFSLLLEGNDPGPMLTVASAGAGVGLELVDIVVRESQRSGDGAILRFRKPSGEDRLRRAVQHRPLRLGAAGDRLTYPELAEAIERATVGLLRERGEPAGESRLAAAILADLQRTGLLQRLVLARHDPDAEDDVHVDAPPRRRGAPSLLASLVGEELARDDHPALVRVGDDAQPLWWLREPQLAESPIADRVEWATFSILSTAGRLDEVAFMDRIFSILPGVSAPDEELVRACLAAYARTGEDGQLQSDEDLGRRQADRSRMIALLADYGHRLGLRVWIAKREQERAYEGSTLGDLLRDDERRAYLPLVVRGPADALAEVDVIWYRRGRMAFLFDVEWTAMLGEPVLRRGRRIEPTDQQARFLVVPRERGELVRFKIERSPWLRDELQRQNWHVLKWQHLETLSARAGAKLDWLEPVLGLDPLIERGGEQLTIFGE
jgi:hypothetical protein